MAAKAPTLRQLPLLDPNQRYTISEAIAYLRTSRKTFYEDLKAGRIKTIEVGARRYFGITRGGKSSQSRLVEIQVASRRFVPGSEILRLSRLPS